MTRASVPRPFCTATRTRAALALIVTVASCGGSGDATRPNDATQSSGPLIGQPAPNLPLGPLHGNKAMRLDELRGKVVLLDVWASWYAPCREELPMLDDMAARLRAKGVEIVGVSIDESRDDAEQFLKSRSTWSIKLAHDPEGKMPGKLQPSRMPSSYIIDRNGIIRQVNAGFARSDARRIESRLIELSGGR
jgi:thiol-disulfide isomerase/thioredoxin